MVKAPVGRSWRNQVSSNTMQVVGRNGSEIENIYHDVIAVTDARSLYDQLARDCPGLA